MGITAAIRNVFTPSQALDPFEQQRLDAIDRRRKLSQKVDTINAKIKAVAAELASLDDAPAKLAAVETAYSEAVVASETGQAVPVPLETLKATREKARQAAADAAQQAIDLERVLAAYRTQLEPLREAQQAIRREVGELAPYVIDERLAALKGRHEAAEVEMRAVLELEAELTLAFDQYALGSARGEFRGSGAYSDINIPRPDHPAFTPSYSDAFDRGRALTAAHDAYHEHLRARDRRAQAIIAEVLHGD